MNLKKILAGVVAGAMAVSAMATVAFAAEDIVVDDNWGDETVFLNNEMVSELDTCKDIFTKTVTAKITIKCTDDGWGWNSGTVAVAYGNEWVEKKFGGSNCVGNNWFPDDSVVVATDDVFDVILNMNLNGEEYFKVCANASWTPAFELISIELSDADGVLATYADGEVTAPTSDDDNTPGEGGNNGDDDNTPGEGGNNGDDDNTPGEGGNNGDDDDNTPGEGDNNGDDDNTPGEGDATTSSDADVSGTGTPTGTGANPSTGVALAIVPAVIAAAGVIVAKKRK